MSASAPFTSADAWSMACTREIELGSRELLIDGERLRILQLQAGVVQDRLTAGTFGLRSREPRFGFGEPRLKCSRVESRDYLAGPDPRVEVDRHRSDRAGDL